MGAVVQRGVVPGIRGIAIVRIVTRQLLVKTVMTGKDITYTLMNCKL
jgi:hypothetical protein